MVASKTSILVAAVALGAASVYAAPATLNKDISLGRRGADKSSLMARKFADDELYAREFYDDLDARDFEDDALEARDFDDDELYARELYEDELAARGFDDDEVLFARAADTPPTPGAAAAAANTATGAPEYCTTIVNALTIIHNEHKHAVSTGAGVPATSGSSATPPATVHRRATSTLPDAETIASKCGPLIEAFYKSHHHHHPHHHADTSTTTPPPGTTSVQTSSTTGTKSLQRRAGGTAGNGVTGGSDVQGGVSQVGGSQVGGSQGGMNGPPGGDPSLPPSSNGEQVNNNQLHPHHHHPCRHACATPGPECEACRKHHHHHQGEQGQQHLDTQTIGQTGTKMRRRSVGDKLYWKRSLATSLGLDEDYFLKRDNRD